VRTDERGPSIRATLRHAAVRTLLGGGTLYFIGNFMQSTAAAWMMVELTGSSFLGALAAQAVAQALLTVLGRPRQRVVPELRWRLLHGADGAGLELQHRRRHPA
jgi:hypothetical protein